jgi:hypothetical protein
MESSEFDDDDSIQGSTREYGCSPQRLLQRHGDFGFLHAVKLALSALAVGAMSL